MCLASHRRSCIIRIEPICLLLVVDISPIASAQALDRSLHLEMVRNCRYRDSNSRFHFEYYQVALGDKLPTCLYTTCSLA
ncbi:hypothetical protein F4860DRAFT_464474 [Xylaria cubensis]|nr:hypothetical protein F4860DRAFT_464474 [Xylaria cubensis]